MPRHQASSLSVVTPTTRVNGAYRSYLFVVTQYSGSLGFIQIPSILMAVAVRSSLTSQTSPSQSTQRPVQSGMLSDSGLNGLTSISISKWYVFFMVVNLFLVVCFQAR
ncbi:hypothetical protein BPSOL_1054 [Bifidobacterium pseudolongum]|nr:hypothetical protein BPSOL_1054 [Bifidobacterium pseudolongum]